MNAPIKKTTRMIKEYTMGYSPTQLRVRQATSNDPWGPRGNLMHEIAELTYNQQDFIEIVEVLDKRLNDKGKNWRHVFKSLTLLDYLLHSGDVKVIRYFQRNLYIIKTLTEFQHIDESGKDQGLNVRNKAKEITALLRNEEVLMKERDSRASMRDRMLLRNSSFDDSPSQRDMPPRKKNTGPQDNEDAELKAAIEASKQTATEEAARAKEDRDNEANLQEAMRLSREEEERRLREKEAATQNALFDDGFQTDGPNAYKNQSDLLVDIGLPANQQNLAPQYTQQQYLQPQYTSMNPYNQYMGMQPQMTGNPYMQPQYTAFNMNPQQNQMDEWNRQQEMLRLQQQQMLQPQHTAIGSNNPFAQFSNTSTPEPQSTSPPPSTYSNINAPSPMSSAWSSAPKPSATHDVSVSTPPPSTETRSTPPQSTQPPSAFNEGHKMLDTMFANKNAGLTKFEIDHDTFGNRGNLRYGTLNPFEQQQQSSAQTSQNGDMSSSATPFFTI